jgi:hypothetical protein
MGDLTIYMGPCQSLLEPWQYMGPCQSLGEPDRLWNLIVYMGTLTVAMEPGLYVPGEPGSLYRSL